MNLGFGMIFGADSRGADRAFASISSSLDRMNRRIDSFSQQMASSFNTLWRSIIHGANSVISKAAEIETSEVMLKFAFRDMSKAAGDAIEQQIQDTGLLTMQTTNEIRDLVTDMKRMSNVNIFDPSVPKLMYQANGEMHEMLNGAVLLGDVASGLQFGTRSARLGIMGLLTDNFASAKKHLDPIASKMDEYKKALVGATTQQEKFARIAPLLARDFGGLSDMQRHTWKYMASQLGDIKEKLTTTFARPFMAALLKPLGELQAYFVGQPNGILLSHNIHKLDGIANAFKRIGERMARAASAAGRLAKRTFEYVQAHPQVVEMAAAIAATATSITGVGAALGSMRMIIRGLIFSFGGLLAALGPFSLIAIPLAGIAFMFAKMKVGGSGVIDVFKRLATVFKAAYEGLSNMRNGVAVLSEETMNTLNDKGLTNAAVGLMKFGYRVRAFFIGIYDGFMSMKQYMWDAFKLVGLALDELFETLGLQAHNASGTWKNTGEIIGKVIGGLVTAFAYGMVFMIKALDFLIEAFGILWDVLLGIRDTFVEMWDWGKKVLDVSESILDPFGHLEESLGGSSAEIPFVKTLSGLWKVAQPGYWEGEVNKAGRALGVLPPKQIVADTAMALPVEAEATSVKAADAGSAVPTVEQQKNEWAVNKMAMAMKKALGGMAVQIDGMKIGEFLDRAADNNRDRGDTR
jgi:hypothetical protein